MLIGFLNRGSFIIHALLPGTSRACTLSVFLLAALCSRPSAGHPTKHTIQSLRIVTEHINHCYTHRTMIDEVTRMKEHDYIKCKLEKCGREKEKKRGFFFLVRSNIITLHYPPPKKKKPRKEKFLLHTLPFTIFLITFVNAIRCQVAKVYPMYAFP